MKKKILNSFLVCIIFLSALITFVACDYNYGAQLTNDQRYQNAVKDSMWIDSDEILPVITLEAGSDEVTWNADGTKVLMLTYNKYPQSYIAGADVKIVWGEVWTVTDKETIAWYDLNKSGVEDWDLRLSQFLGMPKSGYTHISAMWVSPNDCLRPSYNPDVYNDKIVTKFPEDLDESIMVNNMPYKDWFQSNILSSYFSDWKYPWTRLGYTYDWADNNKEYGASEFLIKDNATVSVEFTYTLDEFINWLESK